MKKYISISWLILLLATNGFSQTSGDSLLIVQSRKLANMLKDSLQLNAQQTEQLFKISLSLSQQKKAAFQLQDRSLIGKRLQEIENSRDSLYRQVLTPTVFDVYKQKKVQLLNKPPKG